ncbi:reverse transcriptase family protein [Flavobacterium sp. RSSA_27]|uniref:reverse transcriptase family protein n=1 Tax=Flavobacterium sp. RSSA_27 TaxID=3447667 RepID=UPI003F3B0E13
MTISEIITIAKKNEKQLINKLYQKPYAIGKQLKKLKKHQRNAVLFLSLKKPMQLTRFFNLPFFEIEEIINNPIYTQYIIPKKSGGSRQIEAPEERLKKIQKQLNFYLQAHYLWIKPREVFGFVINPNDLEPFCNIAENAKVHINHKQVLNLDIKDFFPSLTAAQVKQVFSGPLFNFNEQMATAFTLLTTYKGKLPIGAPTSPVLSNFICKALDNDLILFAKENHLNYTRYADDLTFSSQQTIETKTIDQIKALITKHHLVVNEKKVHLKGNHSKQIVTGITVNTRINVDRKLLKKTRAMLHDLTVNGLETATQKHFKTSDNIPKLKYKFLNRLDGYINFIGQIRGKQNPTYSKYKETFKKISIQLEVNK